MPSRILRLVAAAAVALTLGGSSLALAATPGCDLRYLVAPSGGSPELLAEIHATLGLVGEALGTAPEYLGSTATPRTIRKRSGEPLVIGFWDNAGADVGGLAFESANTIVFDTGVNDVGRDWQRTVILHELGHVWGLDHDEVRVMGEVLADVGGATDADIAELVEAACG